VSGSPADLAERARRALLSGEEESLLPELLAAARATGNASLWQWSALLHRSLGDSRPALEAFRAATVAAPDDPGIAHGLAQVTAEAGLDARADFERAIRLKPSLDTLLGHCAARFAAGEGGPALDELAAVLARQPRWTKGHAQWAQLAAMTGQAGRATETIDRALDSATTVELLHAKIAILTAAGRYHEVARTAEQAVAMGGDDRSFALILAAALSDGGDSTAASARFDELGEPQSVDHAIHLARHMIRIADFNRLAALADRWMAGDDSHFFWPYASIVWRETGDPRWQWLEGDGRLVLVQDLDDLPDLNQLAELLRGLHARSGRYLDQSVRGGTQTDGPLLRRIDPEIEQLRRAIERAVERYVEQLPPVDPAHPMLRHRRGERVRFAGSWSVRLTGAGHHSNHVHPQGWISSALYVTVPALDGEDGWLTLGEPQSELDSGLAAIRAIEPRTARLALFPSMMWHGTRPFVAGERMTVAFDVAPPRRS
jgi:tetratricopeptide (TPR) repeat protein